MKKRIMSVFLAIAMILTMMPVDVKAANSPQVSDINVHIVGNGGKFDVSGSGAVNPGNYDGYSQMFEVGITLADSNVTVSEPVSTNGWTFIGWEIFNNTDSENPVFVDGSLTTEDVLNYKLPNFDVLFRACWDISTGNTDNGPKVFIVFDGNGGEFTVTNPYDSFTTNSFGNGYTFGTSVKDAGITITDPVFWDSARTFDGWMICEYAEVTGPDGSTYRDLVQVDGTSLLSTADALAYKLPDKELVFKAQWAGNDDDYYSHVFILAYGGEFEFEQLSYDEQPVKFTQTTGGWGQYLKENGQSINQQLSDRQFNISKEPVRSNATFEGWLEFKTTVNGGDNDEYELVSDKVYTTTEILAKPVPEYNVAYVAKWSDIKAEDYFGGNGGEGMPPNALFAATLDGGKFVVTENINGQQTEYLRDVLTWYTPYGNTLKEALAFENTAIKGAVKEGYTLEGWKVYEFESYEWYNMPAGEELNVGDPDCEFVYFNTFTDPDTNEVLDTYLVMVYPKIYSENLSTEDFLALKAEKSYYAVANWKENPVETPDDSETEQPKEELPEVPDVTINGQSVPVTVVTIEDALEGTSLTEAQKDNITKVNVRLNGSASDKLALQQELARNVAGKNIEKVTYDKLIDLTLPEGTEIPDEGILITIKDENIKAGMNILMLHMKTDGTWEEIVPKVKDGELKAVFHSLSPVYYMEIVETPGSWYYDPEIDGPMTTETVSPKTADNTMSIYVVMLTIAVLGVVLSARHKAK